MSKIDKEELHNIFLGMENNKEFYFNILYEKYKKLIYAMVFSILKDEEDSEDVVQKVYIKIWKMKKQILPKSNEVCWLYTIAKNEAIDLIKYKKKLINIDEIYYISEDDKELNNIISKESYNKILSKLSTQEQEIISLKIISDLSFKEISQILILPESTVKWKYYKSMNTLKRLLNNVVVLIVTFVIGLKIAFNKERKTSNVEENIETEEKLEIKENVSSDTIEEIKTKNSIENFEQDNAQSVPNQFANSTEQIILQENFNENNFYKIGILSVLLIILSIVLIIIIKHKLKIKYKSSK